MMQVEREEQELYIGEYTAGSQRSHHDSYIKATFRQRSINDILPETEVMLDKL